MDQVSIDDPENYSDANDSDDTSSSSSNPALFETQPIVLDCHGTANNISSNNSMPVVTKKKLTKARKQKRKKRNPLPESESSNSLSDANSIKEQININTTSKELFFDARESYHGVEHKLVEKRSTTLFMPGQDVATTKPTTAKNSMPGLPLPTTGAAVSPAVHATIAQAHSEHTQKPIALPAAQACILDKTHKTEQ